MNRRRFEDLALLKQKTMIGFFGSFSEGHKEGLLGLQGYLHDELGYNACISENLESLHPRSHSDKDIRDYEVSEQLIEQSHIHIIVFPFPKELDSHHHDQSATIEYTLIKDRRKPHVVILCEKGLRDAIPDSFGGMMKGSLKITTPGFEPDIIDYEKLEDTYTDLTMICYRFLRKIWF